MQMYQKWLFQLNFCSFKDSKLAPNPETFPESICPCFAKKTGQNMKIRKNALGCDPLYCLITASFFSARSFGVKLSHVLLPFLPTMGELEFSE